MIEQITLTNKSEIQELEKSFPQLFVDFPVNRRLEDNQFTQIFTIFDKDKIVGCLILDFIYERMELVQIEVLEPYRNLHFGSKLMNFMIQEAKKRRLINITLEVRKDNQPAIHLYEKFDFKIVATRKNYYQGVDGYLMERKMM